MKNLIRALGLLALCAVTSLHAQVVARQGDPAVSPLQEFKSPMVLDLPMKGFRELSFDTGKDFKEVRKFYCDDLVISQLLVSKKEDGRRGGIKLEIKGAVSVRPSYDRLAILRFDLVKGEERIATTQISGINAEEGKTRSFATVLRLDANEAAAFLSPEADPILRVTVTVKDNS